ncbi:P-loop containing nucleoside triphosphate hydrolase protein [Chlamydoabsidia padenii]|nr:P-loop containing nucleoside triphosphate hydrolase protein [Chlamydoabsidia padenii]
MQSNNKKQALKDLWQYQETMGCLPPEVDHQGNIEYKFKLVDPSEVRMEHLITQLKWRLTEGKGQALYELGVNDDGTLTGLSDQDMSATLDTLRRMAEALNAEVSIVRELKINKSMEDPKKNYKQMNGGKKKQDYYLDSNGNHKQQQQQEENEEERCVIEAMVRQRTSIDLPSYTDIRVAIVGDTGSGKSTFLAHISHGIKDTGHGTARISLLRHPHEIETGNTSCIAHEMIGYTGDGVLVNSASSSSFSSDGGGGNDTIGDFLYNDNDDLETTSWEQICASSSKVVTFLDTCGHTKYFRTTISALTGYAPDYAMLVVPATSSYLVLTDMTREHVSLVFMLDVPLCVVVTKIDIATTDQIQRCLYTLKSFLSSVSGVRNQHRLPIVISPSDNNNNTDIDDIATTMGENSTTVPIFLVSNVTGAHMNLIHQFLNALPKPCRHKNTTMLSSQSLLEEPAEFQIEQVYTLPDIGVVVGGMLRQGRININDTQRTFALGPNSQGDFIQATVVSIHRHRVPTHYVHYGQTASLAIELSSQEQEWGKIKKGMVLLATTDPASYTTFEATVIVLHHATGLKPGTCGTVRSGFIRQLARVVAIHKDEAAQDDILTSGQQGTCVFQFLGDPEYLRLGAQFLFMEGTFKCLGSITKLVDKINGKLLL